MGDSVEQATLVVRKIPSFSAFAKETKIIENERRKKSEAFKVSKIAVL